MVQGRAGVNVDEPARIADLDRDRVGLVCFAERRDAFGDVHVG